MSDKEIMLKDGLLIRVSPSTNAIFISKKDATGQYQYLGDISFFDNEPDLKMVLFSSSISEIQLGKGGKVENTFTAISDIKVTMNFEQQKKWEDKRIPE